MKTENTKPSEICTSKDEHEVLDEPINLVNDSKSDSYKVDKPSTSKDYNGYNFRKDEYSINKLSIKKKEICDGNASDGNDSCGKTEQQESNGEFNTYLIVKY